MEKLIEGAVAAIVLAVCLGGAALILGANVGLVSGVITTIIKLAAGVVAIGAIVTVIFAFVQAAIP